jgi:hypothetical protein
LAFPCHTLRADGFNFNKVNRLEDKRNGVRKAQKGFGEALRKHQQGGPIKHQSILAHFADRVGASLPEADTEDLVQDARTLQCMKKAPLAESSDYDCFVNKLLTVSV